MPALDHEGPEAAWGVEEEAATGLPHGRGCLPMAFRVGKFMLALAFPLALMGVLAWTLLAPLYGLADLGPLMASKELRYSVRSPGGTWEVHAYYVDPGAMGSASGSVDLVRLSDGKTRKLWTGPPLPSTPVWIDDSTVLVGEQTLDVGGQSVYSIGDAPVGGFLDAREAAEQYVRGLAAGDLEAVQMASRLVVTQETLPELQGKAFGTAEHLEILELTMDQNDSVTASDQALFDMQLLVRWPGGETRDLTLRALSTEEWDEYGIWHAEFAWLVTDSGL